MADLEERLSGVVGSFAKHLVVLVARSEHWQGPYVVTAFVLSVSDQWFLVTAGHVLGDLQEEVAKLPEAGVQFELVDSGGLDARDFTPVPFVLDANVSLVLGDGSDFDYGAIPISPLYRRLLEANGIKALDEEVWSKQPTAPDYFVLLGVPSELVTPQPGRAPDLACSMHVLRYRVDEPDGFKEKKGPRLYFDVALGATTRRTGCRRRLAVRRAPPAVRMRRRRRTCGQRMSRGLTCSAASLRWTFWRAPTAAGGCACWPPSRTGRPARRSSRTSACPSRCRSPRQRARPRGSRACARQPITSPTPAATGPTDPHRRHPPARRSCRTGRAPLRPRQSLPTRVRACAGGRVRAVDATRRSVLSPPSWERARVERERARA